MTLKLEPFSGWPTAWDREVRKVLRLAEQLGIRKLRVNHKLGTLRILEGGKRLLAAVDAADRATQMICPVCGGERERQKGVELQLCVTCQADPGAVQRMPWVDGATYQREQPASVAFDAVDELPYPCFFTIALSYAATGEGVTHAILMAHASSEAQLREEVRLHIEDYFSSSARFYSGLVVPHGFEDLLPKRVRKIVVSTATVQGSFSFFCRYHLNRT